MNLVKRYQLDTEVKTGANQYVGNMETPAYRLTQESDATFFKKVRIRNDKFISVNSGITRIVLAIGKWVIKFPKLSNGHMHFLFGCFANYSERSYCKNMVTMEDRALYNLVAPSIFCSWFGLFQIQKRCIVNTEELSQSVLDRFKNVHGMDTKPNNFGYIDGRLVCLDYPM